MFIQYTYLMQIPTLSTVMVRTAFWVDDNASHGKPNPDPALNQATCASADVRFSLALLLDISLLGCIHVAAQHSAACQHGRSHVVSPVEVWWK